MFMVFPPNAAAHGTSLSLALSIAAGFLVFNVCVVPQNEQHDLQSTRRLLPVVR